MKKIFALLFFTVVTMMSLSAQRSITGTVSDDEGIPLIGANILVKGTTIGTIAEIDGSFSLDVPAGADVVVFSYTGYITQEITLGDDNVLDIILAQNVQILKYM